MPTDKKMFSSWLGIQTMLENDSSNKSMHFLWKQTWIASWSCVAAQTFQKLLYTWIYIYTHNRVTVGPPGKVAGFSPQGLHFIFWSFGFVAAMWASWTSPANFHVTLEIPGRRPIVAFRIFLEWRMQSSGIWDFWQCPKRNDYFETFQ